MAVFITKVWGFHTPAGPLQFSSEGWRANAREQLTEGDLVILVGTKGEPTDASERGRLLGVMEPTTQPVMSLDFELPRKPEYFDSNNEYKWPFGLINRNAWRLLDRPLLSDISDRDFEMNAVLGIVRLTNEEAQKVVGLRREPVELLSPAIRGIARIHGREAARRRISPPPGLSRQPIMHLRSASAYTYVMKIQGPTHVGYKIGWAFDFVLRARQFNLSALPSLGGLEYRPELYELWSTARRAFWMEQELLKHFDKARHRYNHEVITNISQNELVSVWARLVHEGLKLEALAS